MDRRRILALPFAALAASVPALAKTGGDPAVAHANAIRRGRERYREGWFGNGDTRLHFVEAGRGPLVILYHGFPSFWYCWFDQMEALKSRYRVVAVDALGANRSAKPERIAPYRVAALAAQLDALARHLHGNRRFILAGHDWGAALAFAYAQAYPQRLHCVAGFSAPPYNLFLDLVRGDPAQQARSGYMQRFRAIARADISAGNIPATLFRTAYGPLIESGAITPAEAELFRQALADPAAAFGGMNWYRANVPPFAAIGDADYWPARELRLEVPALLVWGEADLTFVPTFLDLFAQAVPQSEIIRIAGVNHWTTMEQSDKATTALAAFVERHGP